MGQAEAATIAPPYGTYEVQMTFLRSDLLCYFDCGDATPIPYAGMTVGDTQRGTLVVKGDSADDLYLDFYWAGGVLADNVFLSRIENNTFWNTSYFSVDFAFVDGRLGGMFTGVNSFNNDDGFFIEQINDFSFNEIAPVPLPATAALLFLGISTLAMMRKRRRA